MRVTVILGFLIFCMQIFLLNAESEYRVKVMNDMFSHPGWLDWHKTDYVHIIDRWININEKFNANDLLTTIFYAHIATNENVESKIQQAHQFLSCKYAKVLKEFCVYERGIGTTCRKLNNQSKEYDCNKELQNTLLSSDALVMLMQGSLSCFHQLSPQTLFNKGFFEILEDFKYYYETINLTSTVVNPYVEEIMSLTIKRLSAFYHSFCLPIPYREEDSGNCKYAKRVEDMNKVDDLDFLIYEISNDIKKMIRRFIESFDGVYGFKYYLESKMTSLMYDPDLIRRVKRMNELLVSKGWSAINKNNFVILPSGLETVDRLLTASADNKIVTKVNVDEKFQLAHHFLTCKYALTLKRCCDYVRLIWKQYSMHFPKTSSYQRRCLNIIIRSYPLIWHMQDALSQFYKLSPHINYNRDVSDILENFANNFYSKIYQKQNSLANFYSKPRNRKKIDRKIIKENLDIETDMTDILKLLIKFYEPNCFPQYLIKKDTFLQENSDVTLRNLEKKFIEEINILIQTNYTDFGFQLIQPVK